MDTEVAPAPAEPEESSTTAVNPTEEQTIPSTTITEPEITTAETSNEPQTEEETTESNSVEKEENTPQPQCNKTNVYYFNKIKKQEKRFDI